VFDDDGKRVEFWARLLTEISLIGRTSCVTTYLPKLEDCEMPRDDEDYYDDGLPRCIVAGFRDWKSRSKKCKSKHPVYKIRLYGNPKGFKYCPLHWIFEHWSRQASPDLGGPITKSMSEDWYNKRLKEVFQNTAGLENCTGHSIRRTAAQWARRCGADLFVIKNVGRWASLDNLALYLIEADEKARARMRNNGGRDPVRDFWEFDPDSQFDTVG
jgi:hypothetical protein